MHNFTPMFGLYVNIGQVFIFGLPVPVSTSAPSGWVFKNVGPKTFYETTSSPWWKTPPAIKPGDSLGIFTYVISGGPVPITAIVTHIQQVTDETGKTPVDNTWFDCSAASGTECIEVTKTANPKSGTIGTVITYTIEVTNCGAIPLKQVTVNDTLLGDITADFVAANGGSSTLAGYQSVQFNVTRAIQAGDPSLLINTVTACGTDILTQKKKCDSDTASVKVRRPCVSITKEASPTKVSVGQNVQYTFIVKNCGDEKLCGITVVDSILGDITAAFVAANAGSDCLEAGNSVKFQVSRTTTKLDPDPLCNTVTVSGKDPNSATAEDDDKACVTIDPPADTVSISGGAFHDIGCNGDLDPTDPPLGGAKFRLTYDDGSYPVVDANGNNVADQVGSTYNFVHLSAGTYRVVQTNPASYASTNAIPGSCPGSSKVTNDIIKVVATTVGVACTNNNFLDCQSKPCIDIAKSVHPIAAPIGTNVTYTFTVINCGNVALTNVTVVDTLLGNITAEFIAAHGSDTLAVSASATFSVVKKVTSETPNPIPNTVTATGIDPFGNEVIDRDDGLTTLPMTISGGAFHDFGCTGTLEPPDAPLDGATFTLTDISGNPVKDIFGNIVLPQTGSTYSFKNLSPGVYVVRETDPPGYVSTNALPGFNAIKLTNDTIQINAITHPNYPNNNFLDCFPKCCADIKLSSQPSVASPGQVVSIKVRICNCGNEPIDVDTLTSVLLGDLTPNFIAANDGSNTLGLGHCVQFSVPFQLPSSFSEGKRNKIGASVLISTVLTGKCETGLDISAEGEVRIVISDPDPGNKKRRCFLPVTFTREGWSKFCDPDNGIINGGMIYNRFPKAFSCFSFFQVPRTNELVIGKGKHTITYSGKNWSLKRLCLLLSQPVAPCGKLSRSLDSPWDLPTGDGGALAVETIVLLLNIAYNNMRLMPRTPGYDLECFTITFGPLARRTVAEAFKIANSILTGDPPCKHGLKSCDEIVEVLRNINANYEFVNFNNFVDRGYLLPNRELGQPDPARCPSVPPCCK